MRWLISIFLILVLAYGSVRGYRHFTRVSPAALPARAEITLTIIPGWNLRQVAEYLVLKGFASSTAAVYAVTGEPAKNNTSAGYALTDNRKFSVNVYLPEKASMEGYLASDTYRVYANASILEVIGKFVHQREQELFGEGYPEITAGINHSQYNLHQILTMASIIEKETKHPSDRPLVADILWRRVKLGWALQVDSSVHYAIDKTGDVFTTDQERAVNSPWNTYKYKGLPPGPICNPSVESIQAALSPEPNKYWYFLSGKDGKMYYAKTLEEHNKNKRYL